MILGPKSEKLLRVAYNALLVSGILGLLWGMAIYNVYLDKLPRSPNPTTGNIYSLNIHGVAVYQTLRERSHLDNVEHGSWAIIIFGGVLGLIWQWSEDEKIRKRNSGPRIRRGPEGG
jgi:hypothetical protein